MAPLTVALLGLGEAGSVLARTSSPPAPRCAASIRPDADEIAGVERAADARAAVDGSDVVLSVTAASAALEAARERRRRPARGPGLRRPQRVGRRAQARRGRGGRADRRAVRRRRPHGRVPRDGLRTPALASGPGAQAFAAHLGPLGMPVEVLGDEPGAAAARKLLRSVFMKGLAAACLESLRAARAAGCEDWMREEIEGVLAGADAALLERLVTGSARHATRRIAEVADARELLAELGVEPRVTAAAGGWLAQLESESDPAT